MRCAYLVKVGGVDGSFVHQARRPVDDQTLLGVAAARCQLPLALLFVRRRDSDGDGLAVVHVGVQAGGLAGGKGGYGTMLRAGSALAQKRRKRKPTLADVGMSRDLAGNRIYASLAPGDDQPQEERPSRAAQKRAAKEKQTAAFADRLLAIGAQIEASVGTGWDTWLATQSDDQTVVASASQRKTQRLDATQQSDSSKRHRSN